ncbi:MAG: cytochrome c3 family protein [Anaerolineae bacterium]
MKRLKVLILLGVVLVVSGFSLLALSSTAVVEAQSSQPDYVGADECSSCHRDLSRTHGQSAHALTLTDDSDAILADFSQGEDLRMVQIPGENAARPFTADDVAYSVGTGRYVQRYLYEVDRHDFRVLPAEWDVQAGEWRALTLAESWDDPAYDWETSCASCHTTGFDVERERWQDPGVQCEACHGPAEAHIDAARDAGRNPTDEELVTVRGAINMAVDPQVCGQCHSQGTSSSGQPYPVGYLPGGDLSQTFTLVPTDQADHWWSTGHANQQNMQYNEWVNSAHARSLVDLQDSGEAQDACLTCHSADTTFINRMNALIEAGDLDGSALPMTTTETAQFGVSCISCHDPHIETEFPAHLVNEPYALCVNCHTDNNVPPEQGIHHPTLEMFQGTQFIAEVPPESGVHYIAANGPTCTTCHMATVPVNDGERISHNPMPILPDAPQADEPLQDACSGCHSDVATAGEMRTLIDDIQSHTRARIEAARAAITDTTPQWVIDALDFVEGDGSYGIHNYAYADRLLDAVDTALGLYPADSQ